MSIILLIFMIDIFLSASLDRARASTDHFYSVMNISLLIEVKRQWATLVLGWVTV